MACADDLAEAKAALHALVIGGGVVRIAFEGESTEFQPADAPRLRAYIRDLEAECGESAATMSRAPARVLY